MSLVTKLGRVYHQELQPIKPHDPLITWYCEVISQIDCYISICRRLLNTKLGKVLTFLRNLTLKVIWTFDHMIKCDVTRQIEKRFIFTLTRLMATTIGRVVTSVRRFGTPKSSPTACYACMWHRKLCNRFFSCSFSPSLQCFWIDWEKIFVYVQRLFPRTCVISTGLILLDPLKSGCVENVWLKWNFLCESMTCSMF